MLDFLVTSKARRRLLQLLWGERGEGTVSELADRTGVGFASAWRELKAMQAVELVLGEQRGASAVFRANQAHPQAEALRVLVARPSRATDEEGRRLRAQLRGLGAPVLSDQTLPLDGPVEETVVKAAQLARRDPSVARALPVCLYRLREQLQVDQLQAYARSADERHALGFFLELTAILSNEPRFRTWAKGLRDNRRHALRQFFFTAGSSRAEKAVAHERAPPVARRWGFVMNMELETFRTTFDKHVH